MHPVEKGAPKENLGQIPRLTLRGDGSLQKSYAEGIVQKTRGNPDRTSVPEKKKGMIHQTNGKESGKGKLKAFILLRNQFNRSWRVV